MASLYILGGIFMAVVTSDFFRHENLVRKSIQIPSTRHKELKALAVELDSSLGDIVETIMELMQQDNYQQVRSAIIQKRERDLSSMQNSLDEAYAYLGSLPETLEDAHFYFEVGREGMVA
jgi:ArsR family metal-binding transcriptional regulator